MADIDEELVYHADILIFGLILVAAVTNIPRAYTRFSRRSEWSQGHRLYAAVTRKTMNPVINLNPPISYPIDSTKDFDLNTGPSLTACETLPYRGNMRLQDSEKELPRQPTPPQRVFPLSALTSVSRYRVHDNYSIGQVLLMLVYTGIIFYVSFYKSNPFTDPHRAGWVITSQVPFVYALATKNNIIGMMVGVGYEKVCFDQQMLRTPLNATLS
jgi:ferric-chelate reductase